MGPRVSHIKYRNLYAGSAKCNASGKHNYKYIQKNRASRTTRLARSRSPIMCKPAGPAKLKCREICNSTPPCYICRCITRKDHPGARKMNRDITTATATSSPDAVLSQENIASKYESPQTLAVREKAIRERQWSVVISCTVAIILCLTTGISISITSNVILDLEMGLPAHQLTTFQQSVFAVSPHACPTACY